MRLMAHYDNFTLQKQCLWSSLER